MKKKYIDPIRRTFCTSASLYRKAINLLHKNNYSMSEYIEHHLQIDYINRWLDSKK